MNSKEKVKENMVAWYKFAVCDKSDSKSHYFFFSCLLDIYSRVTAYCIRSYHGRDVLTYLFRCTIAETILHL